MNPSTYPSVHSAADIHYYSSAGVCYDTTQPSLSYAHYSSGLYEDLAPSVDVQYAGLGPYSDADRALFEEFLTAEARIINPSDSCTVVAMQLPPSESSDSASNPLRHLGPLLGSQPYPYATSSLQSNLSPSFKQPSPEPPAARISPTIYPSLQPVCSFEEGYSTTTMPVPDHVLHRMSYPRPSSYPYPSPSPEPSLQASSGVIASSPQGIPPYTGLSHTSLAFEHHLPEPTVACVSPDLIYPSAFTGYDLEDGRLNDVSPQCSRLSGRASRRSSPSAPYPTPSPEPSPPTSSAVFASQRRNAPARTAAPVPSSTWQCPHCPYVQRNRRSPDLKRHIKTHTRGVEVADWVCCGVPVLDAIELGVPAGIVQERRMFNFDGVPMIGGCRKAFSRRDALHRHLQREGGKCFGDAWSLHQRGNRDNC